MFFRKVNKPSKAHVSVGLRGHHHGSKTLTKCHTRSEWRRRRFLRWQFGVPSILVGALVLLNCSIISKLPFGIGDSNGSITVVDKENGPIYNPCNETSVIIISSFIPTTPSLRMINATIQSLRHLHGLCPTSPIFIAVDGLSPDTKNSHNDSIPRMQQYIQALNNAYNQDHFTIVANNRSMQVTGNVKSALDLVQTEFVYVLQHDMPFIRSINHSAVIKTMREYPEILRLVRFHLKPNTVRKGPGEHRVSCYNMTTPVDHVNGIDFIKTWLWSDNNHLTLKSYYEEMFRLFHERLNKLPPAMEFVMRNVASENCSFWGPFYYGRYGAPPTIEHLDGQRTQ